jgi:hypothetical protein
MRSTSERDTYCANALRTWAFSRPSVASVATVAASIVSANAEAGATRSITTPRANSAWPSAIHTAIAPIATTSGSHSRRRTRRSCSATASAANTASAASWAAGAGVDEQLVVEQVVQERRVQLDAVGQRIERRRHLVVGGVGEADDHDLAAQLGGADPTVEHRRRRHPREALADEVEARDRRQRAVAERHAAARGDEAGRLLGRERGERQPERLVVAAAVLDHQRHAARHAVVVAEVIDRARGDRALGHRRQRERDGVGARHRRGAADRLAQLGAGEARRLGRRGGRALGGGADQAEQRAEHDHLGVGDRRGQRVVAVELGDDRAERRGGLGQGGGGRGLGAGRGVGGLDLGGQRVGQDHLARREEQIERDRLGAGRGQRADQPGPAVAGLDHVAGEPPGVVVDADDHDPRVAQRPRAAGAEPPVERALLEAVDARQVVRAAVAEHADRQRDRQGGRDEQRPVPGRAISRTHVREPTSGGLSQGGRRA